MAAVSATRYLKLCDDVVDQCGSADRTVRAAACASAAVAASSPPASPRWVRFSPAPPAWLPALSAEPDANLRFARSPAEIARFSSTARERWTSEATFILAAVGCSIGFGNVWRFPMLAYEYGGGAFLVPYTLALFVLTIPMVVLEFGLGQMHQASHPGMVSRLAPGAGALGWATTVGVYLVTMWFQALLAYCAVYACACALTPLPWSGAEGAAGFYARVIDASGSGFELGALVPWLVGAYALVWACVFAGARGLASSLGRLCELLVPLPLLVLGALLVRGLTLEGAAHGVRELFTPRWSVLLERPDIWPIAISQSFFSTGAGSSSLTTYASYNSRSSRVLRPALVVPIANACFSLVAATVVFAFLGHLSHTTGVPLAQVAVGGSSLAFEVFPQVLALMPWPRAWSVAFFLMLLNIGLTSAASQTSPLCVALIELGKRRGGWLASEKLVPVLVHAVGFGLGLVYVTRAGPFWIDIGNHYLPLLNNTLAALYEALLVGAVYGAPRLLRELSEATGERTPRVHHALAFIWQWVLPPSIGAVLLIALRAEGVQPYGGYSSGFRAVGWALGAGPMAAASMAAVAMAAARSSRCSAVGAAARRQGDAQKRASDCCECDGLSDAAGSAVWFDAEQAAVVTATGDE